MTTLRRELRTKFEEVLSAFSDKLAVPELEPLAEQLADAALQVAGILSAAQRREEAEQRIAEQRANKKDPIDFLVENSKEIKMLQEMRLRVESATGLGLSREWDKTRSPWNGYEKTLIKREVETGQTIEQFMEWYNSDEFRKKSDIWLNPDKIELMWGKAFTQKSQDDYYHAL